MASQSVPLPDRLVLTEDQWNNLREQAAEQNIDLSEALARSIQISSVVVKNTKEPGSKVLFKKGNEYRELVTNWR